MALSKVASREDLNNSVEIVRDDDGGREIEMTVSPEAMSFIIDRLTDIYTRPIDASVREVVSNAIDATRKMLRALQKPIEVTLPTALRSTLTVRDHGIGMSELEVEKVFSQYGASTKRTDMNQTGAYASERRLPLPTALNSTFPPLRTASLRLSS